MCFVRDWLLQPVISTLEGVSMKQAELLVQLHALTTQVTKIRSEVGNKIAALEQAVRDASDGELSPEVEAALTEARAAIQTVDDLHPDEVVDQVQREGVDTDGAQDLSPEVATAVAQAQEATRSARRRGAGGAR